MPSSLCSEKDPITLKRTLGTILALISLFGIIFLPRELVIHYVAIIGFSTSMAMMIKAEELEEDKNGRWDLSLLIVSLVCSFIPFAAAIHHLIQNISLQ